MPPSAKQFSAASGAGAGQGSGSLGKYSGEAARSKCAGGCCPEPNGTCSRWCSIRTTLMKAAIPSAASGWPMFGLTEPSATGCAEPRR